MDGGGDGQTTTIRDIPPEVLKKILGKLWKDSDLKNSQDVCTLWSYLVNAKVGRRVCVGCRVSDGSTKVDLEQLFQIGVRSCFMYIREENENLQPQNQVAENEEQNLGEIEDAPEDQNEDGHEAEGQHRVVGELRYPYLLKDLSIYGSISADLFVGLSKNARNLTSFSTTMSVIAKLRNEDLRNLPFPKLKRLLIEETSFVVEEGAQYVPILKTLLETNRFTQLTYFYVRLPLASFMDLSTTRMLMTFVQDHYALQKLALLLHMTTDGTNNVIPVPDMLGHQELRNIIAGIRSRGDCHLKELDIRAWVDTNNLQDGFGFLSQIEIFKEFFLKLISLEDLWLNLSPIPNSTVQAICTRNSTTLKRLSFVGEHSNVDCNMFTSLKNIQSIYLDSDIGIVGITQLPRCLTSIRVSGPIQQADANHLLNRPNMERIGLYWERPPNNDNPREGSCVTLDMLNNLNENRNVTDVQISYDCLEDPESFPPEGISNNDPTNPVMLPVYATHGVNWSLNEDGFYESL